MQTILQILQIILSIILVAVILLQSRGSGLGSAFGGGGSTYRTRRGIEQKLHYATIAIAILFFATSLLNILIS